MNWLNQLKDYFNLLDYPDEVTLRIDDFSGEDTNSRTCPIAKAAQKRFSKSCRAIGYSGFRTGGGKVYLSDILVDKILLGEPFEATFIRNKKWESLLLQN